MIIGEHMRNCERKVERKIVTQNTTVDISKSIMIVVTSANASLPEILSSFRRKIYKKRR